MTTTIHSHDLDSVIDICAVPSIMGTVAFHYEPYILHSSFGNDWYPYGDPIPQILDKCVLVLPQRDAEHALRLSSRDLTDEYNLTADGMKPVNGKYHQPRDAERYGGLWSSLIANGTSSSLPARFKRDHEVTHANHKGDIWPKTDQSPTHPWYETVMYTWGWVLPGLSAVPLGTPGVSMASAMNISALPLSPSTTTPQYSVSAGKADMLEVLETLDDFSYIGAAGAPLSRVTLSRSVSDLTHSWKDGALVVSYFYESEEHLVDGSWGHAKWHCEIKVSISSAGIVDDLSFPHNASPNYTGIVSYTHRCIFHNGYGFDTEFSEHQTEIDSLSGSYVTIGFISDASSPVYMDLFAISLYLTRGAMNFSSYVESMIYDVRTSAFFATADAVESHLELLKNNYLETLSELPALAQLIPNIGGFVKALVALRRNPSEGLLKLGDALADLTLKFNFGWVPDAAAVEELNEHGPEIMSAFERFQSPSQKKVAGKFTFMLPTHPFWGDVSLITRATLNLSYSDAGFATKILGLESVGVLPSLHRVWEALPYSFVVDWATHMGRRLHDIDTTALFGLLRLSWAIYSYKLEVDFPYQSSLSEVDWDRSSVQLVLFRRDLSTRFATPRDCKFDYRQATRLPSFGIVSSLLFKRLR